MTDLIKKLEALEAPCRECDAEIALAVGFVKERDHNMFYGNAEHSVMVLERGYYDHEANAPELPHYTASIDAAMTLVPEGWRGGFEQGSWHDKAPNKSIAWVWPFESSYNPGLPLGYETGRFSNPDGFQGYAATPAIALCIAALRAQEASNAGR